MTFQDKLFNFHDPWRQQFYNVLGENGNESSLRMIKSYQNFTKL